MSSFSGVHIYNHTKVNTHLDEFHSSSVIDHAHLENTHIAFDTHQSHHPSLHQHLDDYFIRSARQRESEGKLFITRVFTVQKLFLNLSQLAVVKRTQIYNLASYYWYSPFVSSNQPLLI